VRNYPIRCFTCRQTRVFPAILPEHIFQETLVKDVPITKCNNCGDVCFTEQSDNYMRNYKKMIDRLKKFLTNDEIENGFPGFREKLGDQKI
jgi:hypothetical protein